MEGENVMEDYIKIGEDIYLLTSYCFIDKYYEWDDRQVATLRFAEEFDVIKDAFVNDVVWVLVEHDEEGAEIERDCSAWNMPGAITDHRNGEVTILMGKPTELERMIEIIYGGVN